MDRSLFESRLLQLRGERSRNSVSLEMRLNPQTIERYEKGQRLPDVETASIIANYYKVSVDWLLGINDNIINDREFTANISNYIGLNENTIELLHILKENDIEMTNLLSELLYNNSFLDILRNILTLKNDSKRLRDNFTSFIEKRSSLSFNVEQLDVSRYAIHKILGTILDCYDLRCESDYKSLEKTVSDNIDAALYNLLK